MLLAELPRSRERVLVKNGNWKLLSSWKVSVQCPRVVISLHRQREASTDELPHENIGNGDGKHHPTTVARRNAEKNSSEVVSLDNLLFWRRFFTGISFSHQQVGFDCLFGDVFGRISGWAISMRRLLTKIRLVSLGVHKKYLLFYEPRIDFQTWHAFRDVEIALNRNCKFYEMAG